MLVVSLAPMAPVHADAIMVTKAMTAPTVAEVFIERGEVRVEIETGLPDLVAFSDLFPDEFRIRMGLESEPEEERHRRFFSEGLVIRADDGDPLAGELRSFETRRRVPREEITGAPLPAPEGAGEPVVFMVLSYPFDGTPSSLSIRPPTDDGGVPQASIGFMTYHLGLPVMDFRYLGAAEAIDLDWDDPWYSKFRNRNLWRQYDAPINVFLYVEPFEVRVEIVARPRDVQAWSDVGIDGLETIPVEIQEDVKQRVAEFFAAELDLTVDGDPVTPTLDRVNFLERTLRTSTVISPPRELDASAATLGVIFLHPMSGYPEEAEVTWTRFPDRVERIPAAATDEAGPLRFFLQRDDNVLWWKNHLKRPTLPALKRVVAPPSLILRLLVWVLWPAAVVAVALGIRGVARTAGGRGSWIRAGVFAIIAAGLCFGAWSATRASSLDQARVTEIVDALLHNVYRAFDFRDEELIYDTLQQSVAGDLLTETYLETRRSLELASQGGARAKVQTVEIVDVASETDGDALRLRCTWNVAAAVGHWGHIHQRRNQYVADLSIEPIDGRWKITGLELVDEQRL